MTSLPGLVDNAGCRGAGATGSGGLWKRRGPGVLCGKDWVPGSVENTGSVVFVTTRPKYTKYKRHSLHCFQKKLTDICNKIADSEFFYGKERVHERNVSRLTRMNIFPTRNVTS